LNEPFQVDRITSNLKRYRARTSAHSARARSVENSSARLNISEIIGQSSALAVKVAAQEPNIYALIDDLQEKG
jgi:D-serine deaminase-like pyridoxal phosphate-dependent protein